MIECVIHLCIAIIFNCFVFNSEMLEPVSLSVLSTLHLPNSSSVKFERVS